MKLLRKFTIFLPIFTITCSVFAVSASNDSVANKVIDKIDKAIQTPIEQLPRNDKKVQKKNEPIKTFPDIYYEYRIEQLNKLSPIRLDFTENVRKYIEIYTQKKRDDVAVMLGLFDLYFPVFEQYLDKYNLPLELKYLPIVESGLNPKAQSSSGAMGLWQLLMNSSKLLGLEVNSYVDERCDLYLSTDAACRYLKYLYGIFDDWQLALAAYNGGPGEVRNAIIRSGGKTDFWEIQQFLPDQTKYYVPEFIAAVYIANYASEHGIKPQKTALDFEHIDTLQIIKPAEFTRISELLNIPVETLRLLNPSYRRDIIPDSDEPQTLVLPSDKISAFLKIENQIYSKTKASHGYLELIQSASDTSGLKKYSYTVAQGDFLHKIALQYGCNIENIRAWNNLSSDKLKTGEKLILWLNKDFDFSQLKHRETKDSSKYDDYIYYTVKKGDTIWSIAEKFNCDSIEQLKVLNNITNDKKLKPGQRLKISRNMTR
jgi:membrane-bound lytic murein transglycosylase D